MRRAQFIVVIILLMSAICSCRSVRYVPVETVRSDTVYLNRVQLDSVYVMDSVFIDRAGDTIREWRYRYIYKYKDKIDTVYVARTDSVQVPYPVEVVEYKTPQWCWWTLGGIALLLVPYIVKLINKLKGLGFLKI